LLLVTNYSLYMYRKYVLTHILPLHQSSHPLRKLDFWSEFGPFGEMAPKWLRNSDTLTIGAIVIDYINTLRVFQHKQDEYSPLTPSRTPNGPSYMSD